MAVTEVRSGPSISERRGQIQRFLPESVHLLGLGPSMDFFWARSTANQMNILANPSKKHPGTVYKLPW
jgi:hypothetical protein